MSKLKLEIIDDSLNLGGSTGVKHFDKSSGTIGRGKENDWVLIDDERYLSSVHAQIEYSKGVFHLKDTSTNGVFINGSDTSLRESGSHAIAIEDQMMIKMGLYTLRAETTPDSSAFASFEGDNTDLSNMFLGDLPSNAMADSSLANDSTENLSDPFSLNKQSLLSPTPKPDGTLTTGLTNNAFGTLDPLEALLSKNALEADGGPNILERERDKESKNIEQASLSLTEEATMGNSLMDQAFISSAKKNEDQRFASIDKTASADELPPSNWDQDDVPYEEHNKNTAIFNADTELDVAPPPAVPTPASEVVTTQPVLRYTTEKNEAASLQEPSSMEKMLVKLGFDTSQINCQEVNEQWVDMMPMLLEGLVEMLRTRGEIKKTFNVEKTSVKLEENNPIKFSNNAKTAIDNLFINPKSGFTPAKEAIDEAISDLTCHQQAMTAGFQRGLEEFFRQLSPEAITQEITDEQEGKSFFEKLNRPTRWSFYQKKYNNIMKYSNHSFISFFGNEFVMAYEKYIHEEKKIRFIGK